MTKKTGTILGDVIYRAGDGPQMTIPRGPCAIDAGSTDVTISWGSGDDAGSAAITTDMYTTYLTSGQIELA